MNPITIGEVVQFTERHKWCGCLGIVTEVKRYSDLRIRYMIGVPIPEQGTAYIFVTDESEIERIGRAAFMSKEDVENDR